MNNSICDLKDKLIIALNELENMKKMTDTNNHLIRIILEETIALQWPDIKKMIPQLKRIIADTKKTTIFNIPEIRDLLLFTEKFFESRIGPCKFTTFLQELLSRKDIIKNIRFFKWVLSDDSICNRAFRQI